jgi:hypothetical protein
MLSDSNINMKKKLISSAILLLLPTLFFGQQKINSKLATLYTKGKLKSVNRSVEAIYPLISKDSIEYIQVSEGKKEGIIWLPFKELENGIIRVEMRGKDVLQQSFIGIVFHGLNDSTYDAVYCRPFNFLAKDSVRRIHAIQYISHPEFTWKRLRDEKNAVFEKEISNPPDPNGWFTMKLVIEKSSVKAYINKSELPSLIVEKVNSRATGKIGLFTGDGSGGDFKIIKISYKNKN